MRLISAKYDHVISKIKSLNLGDKKMLKSVTIRQNQQKSAKV